MHVNFIGRVEFPYLFLVLYNNNNKIFFWGGGGTVPAQQCVQEGRARRSTCVPTQQQCATSIQPTTMKREKEKREKRTASIARRGVGSFLDQMTSDVTLGQSVIAAR